MAGGKVIERFATDLLLVPGDERLVGQEPRIHAQVCRFLARQPKNPTACGAIAWATSAACSTRSTIRRLASGMHIARSRMAAHASCSNITSRPAATSVRARR